jgi:hypothetical protein
MELVWTIVVELGVFGSLVSIEEIAFRLFKTKLSLFENYSAH